MVFKLRDGLKVKREYKTTDIVERKGVITAKNIHLKKYPVDNPVTIFNASIDLEGDELIVYGRIVLGYFTYASAVAEFRIPVNDILSNEFIPGHYTADICVYPDNRYDLWGVEDPRVYRIGEKKLMTYCGRTVHYFDPSVRTERTLPVTAVYEDGKWRKICAFRVPEEFRGFVISDKDSFLVKMDRCYLFHRLHMKDENFYLVMSVVECDIFEKRELCDVSVNDTRTVLEPAKWEDKLGWNTPPVKVDGEYLLLLHAVDAETKAYRVFAMLMDENANVTAITPHYIMEPRECYEVFGDRPFTVFPCGSLLIDDQLLISYGASDSAIGFGSINVDELMDMLEKGRLERQ